MTDEFGCAHIAIVSVSATECQCMDCLRVWPKEREFVSDWPDFDRYVGPYVPQGSLDEYGNKPVAPEDEQ